MSRPSKPKTETSPDAVRTPPSLHVRFGTGEEAFARYRRLSIAAAMADMKPTTYAEKVLSDHIKGLPPVKG